MRLALEGIHACIRHHVYHPHIGCRISNLLLNYQSKSQKTTLFEVTHINRSGSHQKLADVGHTSEKVFQHKVRHSSHQVERIDLQDMGLEEVGGAERGVTRRCLGIPTILECEDETFQTEKRRVMDSTPSSQPFQNGALEDHNAKCLISVVQHELYHQKKTDCNQ